MKIFFVINDGVGIRNFIHSNVLKHGKENHELILWSNLGIIELLANTGFTVKKLPPYKTSGTIEILRGSIMRAELVRNARKFKNPYFLYYIIKRSASAFRLKFKEWITGLMGQVFGFDDGVLFLRTRMKRLVSKTSYYDLLKQELEATRPDLIVITHQRAPDAIAIAEAARVLNIPTCAFIFSWDNLPKGTLMTETDHYLVWSDYMKRELQQYYPNIKADRIHITGTPQFMTYFVEKNYIDRNVFANTYGLDAAAVWICFSGDDELTSPFDPLYLNDLVKAVNQLNQRRDTKIQIVFRPSPADISSRYQQVIAASEGIVKLVPPQWRATNNNAWNALIPTAEDNALLCTIVKNCAAVFNVGSTMAIDFSILNKPTAYFRYNTVKSEHWDIFKVYKFIHFNTMGSLEPVYWLNSAKEIAAQVIPIIDDVEKKAAVAKQWQAVIAASPLQEIDVRMWKALEAMAKQF